MQQVRYSSTAIPSRCERVREGFAIEAVPPLVRNHRCLDEDKDGNHVQMTRKFR